MIGLLPSLIFLGGYGWRGGGGQSSPNEQKRGGIKIYCKPTAKEGGIIRMSYR